jgi:hypothetical protein
VVVVVSSGERPTTGPDPGGATVGAAASVIRTVSGNSRRDGYEPYPYRNRPTFAAKSCACLRSAGGPSSRSTTIDLAYPL